MQSNRADRILNHLAPSSSFSIDSAKGLENPLFNPPNHQVQKVIRWLEQKYQLQQDSFLVSEGGPLSRWIAFHYCSIYNREFQYLPITRDTTESDLKQRREIIEGGTSIFIDQPVLIAAIKGQILIIEGLEKAERNVLPVLNNLLENREMALEDGRFLISPARYEALISEVEQQRQDPLTTKHKQVRIRNLLLQTIFFKIYSKNSD